MANAKQPKFRIYPSIGIARLGNGPATKDQVIFSPEIPWANLYETDKEYRTKDGALKKQAQRFYIYECDENGVPIRPVNEDDFEITWSVEVANKKPFWYDFNNSLDLSVLAENQNLSPNFVKDKLAPGIGAKRRNPNVLNQELRVEGGYDYRKELVNNPDKVTVDNTNSYKHIAGEFPSSIGGVSKLAASMRLDTKPVNLGTIEYDKGTLIFYGADGKSAALNPSDLNNDFADNSNWYDDICDGKVTASITPKKGKDKKTHHLDDQLSSAWVATAPPDYAPQIQPLSTMYDLIAGAANDSYTPELSLVFPMFYRLYRMQWVNLGDFLSPSFKETIDELTHQGNFKYIYSKGDNTTEKEIGNKIREKIFKLFRNPAYHYDNEPIIPSKDKTDIENRGSGTEELKLPYYPGDGIDYPGSPAQWFAIPPMIYEQLKKWRDGEFETPPTFDFKDINEMGAFYRQRFLEAAKDEAKKPLLMTRAVLETLYGGGFHPGVELTWPMRHNLIYSQNTMTYKWVTKKDNFDYGFYGLREVRINAATSEEQEEIFYNDFGFQMNSEDIRESMNPKNEKNWLWKITPGDLTKWMGIPWQSDAGSCQAVFVEAQYPIPSWWAANLPVQVLPNENYLKLKDPNILPETKRNIYANRLAWLRTADTGFVGYHAEGGYLNGLINMVYQWDKIGVVAGRKLDVKELPELVYVSYSEKDTE
ncbi:LodA/GoxA family CTQ-dependent oxidase [Aquimarina sp. 2201CG5-10]|uniref:LodA/GoxA family CTQ-dependent oxidase n=1 Tax=Aquimarina callyspongiae TaxID=3098150 RepID=UPI002AB3603D|nr:LodA/GoxA family CTQ-dependent oxidase [Aquimarina sp. 2201CG5-10]MDY8138144.1 LodA/GoxA family CTQ-dependent oxidase [Aquimarina sp. 2201CG5-10]